MLMSYRSCSYLSEVGLFVDEVGCAELNFVVVFFVPFVLFVGGGTTTTPADAYL